MVLLGFLSECDVPVNPRSPYNVKKSLMFLYVCARVFVCLSVSFVAQPFLQK